MTNKFRNIDFTAGIHARDIQYNFNVTNEQLKRERLRVGGFGIVEGFELEILSSTQVKINRGTFISNSGEETIIGEKTINIPDPVWAERKITTLSEAITVNQFGQIVLPHIPYSSNRRGFFTTHYYQTVFPTNELIIRDALNPTVTIRAIQIAENIITIDANTWSNKRVFVEYRHTNDRLDTILLDNKGNVEVEQSVVSTSPSHIELERYDDYFVIGLVLVTVGNQITLTVFEDYKTFRKVYVDKNNRLWLNGKLYKESQAIYFEEPTPYLNALWYDKEANKLMIWKDEGGTLGWVAVNEETHIPLRETKIFSPEENPTDLQTFLFDENEINLRFIPGHNQLEVVIDNATLMSDQYEELTIPQPSDYTNAGIGFRLKNQLDRATHVEVKVLHTVQSSPMRKTFQRAAVFVDENFTFHTNLNTAKEFETDTHYIIGEGQLEVFIDGIRADRNMDFEEILIPGAIRNSINNGRASTVFRILRDIEPGQRISHRITKNIYSYDHISGMVEDIDLKAEQALDETSALRQDLETFEMNIDDQFDLIDNNIIQLANAIGNQNDFIKKTDTITPTNLPAEILSKLFGSCFRNVTQAQSIVTIQRVTLKDFILVFYVSQNINRVLLPEIDYDLQEEGANVFLILNPALVDMSSSLYITGIRFGFGREE